MYKKILPVCVIAVMAVGLSSCSKKTSDEAVQEQEQTEAVSTSNSQESEDDVIRIEDSDYTN